MSAVSGIVFGAALAVYILSHYDRRVKKVYALVVALIAALTALADFTSTPIQVGQTCNTTVLTVTSATQTTTTTTSTTTTTVIINSKQTATITQTYPVVIVRNLTTTQTYPYSKCSMQYASDPTALIAFVMSIILMIMALIEMSMEGISSAWP